MKFLSFFTKQTSDQEPPALGWLRAFSWEDFISQMYLVFAMGFVVAGLVEANRVIGSFLNFESILLAALLFGGVLAYRFRAIGVMLTCLVGLLAWVVVQTEEWSIASDLRPATVVAAAALYAFSLYIIGRVYAKHPVYKQAGVCMIMLGIMIMGGVLLALSMHGVLLDFEEKLTHGSVFFYSWQVSLFMTALVFATIFVGTYGMTRKSISLREFLVMFTMLCLCTLPAVLPQQNTVALVSYAEETIASQQLTSVGVFWALLYNIAVFAFFGLLMLHSYRHRRFRLARVSACILVILVMVKYVDWLYGRLDNSIFFLGAGVLLLVLGSVLHRSRKYVSGALVPLPPAPASEPAIESITSPK